MTVLMNGGPMAMFAVVWGVLAMGALAWETGRRRRVAGLQEGLMGVLWGVGAFGTLFGFELVCGALSTAPPADHLEMAARGTIVATYPLLVAALVATVLTPWMTFNRSLAQVEEPVSRSLGAATTAVLALGLLIGAFAASGPILFAVDGDALPTGMLAVARWTALLALPLGLVNLGIAARSTWRGDGRVASV